MSAKPTKDELEALDAKIRDAHAEHEQANAVEKDAYQQLTKAKETYDATRGKSLLAYQHLAALLKERRIQRSNNYL